MTVFNGDGDSRNERRRAPAEDVHDQSLMAWSTVGDGSTAATYAPDAGMVCASLTIAGEEQLDQRSGRHL